MGVRVSKARKQGMYGAVRQLANCRELSSSWTSGRRDARKHSGGRRPLDRHRSLSNASLGLASIVLHNDLYDICSIVTLSCPLRRWSL